MPRKNSRESEEDWLRSRAQGDLAANATEEGFEAFAVTTLLSIAIFEILNVVAIDKLNIPLKNAISLFALIQLIEIPAAIRIGFEIGIAHEDSRSL